jgi:hypothetical protein
MISEHVNHILGPLKGEEFLDQLSHYQFTAYFPYFEKNRAGL